MFRFLKFLGNMPLGIFFGAVSMLVLAWNLDQEFSDNVSKNRTYFFTAFATLLGSAFAIAGVLFSVDRQQRVEEEKRERKVQSARAFLPNALSQVCDIARQGFHVTYTYSGTGQITMAVAPTDLSLLAMSDETVSIFRDLIENSSNGPLRDRIAEILREHQVLIARTRGVAFRSANRVSAEDYRHATHWAYFYSLTGSLFDFARGETETVNTQIEDTNIRGFLHVENIFLSPHTTSYFDGHIGYYARHFQRRFPTQNAAQ